MGTDIDNVLEDIDDLKEHLEYLATCCGTKNALIMHSIDKQIDELKALASLINTK